MRFYRYNKIIPFLFAFFFVASSSVLAQNRDDFPVREYTNPEELVTFDRTTSFGRALDVINQFAQEYRDKIIIDRTGTEGSIGISVPPMHWMDALELILRVKQLQLLDLPEYYEIVLPQQPQQPSGTTGGGAANAAGIEGPIATLDTRAVRINAIFFEGNRRALQEIGVDWSTLSENVPEAILGEQGQGQQQGGEIPSAEFEGPFVQVDSKGASNVSQSVFNALVNVGEIGNSGIEVQALFSAFEADNLGEIIASPTIKVIDGVEGRIQVGQDFSIKQRDFAGNVVEQFFSVGTILTVTPQIIEQDGERFIHLTINAERSTAQPDPVSTIINKTQAQTEALLLNGEATSIAGLYRTEQVEVRRGVPILKDLPGWFFGLKYLFGYNSDDQIMRELVIIIQAEIVPSIPDRIANGNVPGGYEALQNERTWMRDELEKAENAFGGEPIEEELEEVDQSVDEDLEESEPEGQPEEDLADKPQTEKEAEEVKDPPVVSDPEVNNQIIELDLGGEADSTSLMNNDITMPADTVSKQAQEAEKPVQQPEKPVAKNESAANFFIIGGSFNVEENAVDLKNSLRERGFDAVILEKSGSDIMMVAYGGYTDFEEARASLADIQKNQNADAWLYRKD